MSNKAMKQAREKAKKYVEDHQKEMMMTFLDHIQAMRFTHKLRLCYKLLFGRKKK